MSSAAPGSVAGDSPSAGTPVTQSTPEANGSADGVSQSPFHGLLDEGTREWVEKKGFKSVEDGFKAHHLLETKLGSSVQVPGKDATQEEWNKFYSRVGRPEKPDAYEFKRPDSLPKELPYDEALAGQAKAWSYEAGLSPRQAQLLHDKYAQAQADRVKAHLESVAKSVEEAHDALTKEWGPKDSPEFKARHALADRALKKLGLLESFQRSSIILPSGELTDANLAKALALVGEKMFAEDSIDGDPAEGGENPFKDPMNLTAVSHLINTDRERAITLCKAAGKDPVQWVGKL